MLLGDVIKNLREENGYTRKYLAERLNISYSALANYENNARYPDADMIKRIAELFNISIDYLLNNNSKNLNFEYIMLKYNSLSDEGKKDFEKLLELLIIRDSKDKYKNIRENA